MDHSGEIIENAWQERIELRGKGAEKAHCTSAWQWYLPIGHTIAVCISTTIVL